MIRYLEERCDTSAIASDQVKARSIVEGLLAGIAVRKLCRGVREGRQ